MQLISLEMKNFCTVGETTVPLNVPGLVLISGNNQDATKADSNGAGKSTLIGGITYALWGECPNGLSADEVVHNKVNKDCHVTLTLLEDDGTQVSITRTRKDTKRPKPNDLILLVNGVDISASTVEETQVKLDNIIGMDFHTFCAMMPGTGVKLASMTDKHIKSLFEKVLRTEELSQAHKVANDKYKSLNKELDLDKKESTELNTKLADIQLKRMGYETNSRSFASQREKDVAAAQTRLTEATKEAQEAAKVFKKLTKPGTVTELKDKHQTASEELRKVSAEVQSWQDKKDALKADYEKKQGKLAAKLEMLASHSETCPTCGSTLEASHQEDLEEQRTSITTKLAKLEADFDKLYQAYSKKQSPLLPIAVAKEEEVRKLQKELDNYEASVKEYAAVKKSTTSALSLKEAAQRTLEEVQARENVYQTLIEETDKEISELTAKLKQVSETIREKAEKVSMLKFWVDSFSPSGIRSHMLENIAPYLNERAEYYCNVLTAGEMSVVFNTKTTQKSGKEVEKFQIEVKQAHGASSWKGSSAGEKARADLVISLVLGDLATLRASKRLNWRVIDEMLDPLDESGDSAVVELLQQIAQNNTSVYLITHKTNLKDQTQKEIVMTKKSGFSYLEEVKDRN